MSVCKASLVLVVAGLLAAGCGKSPTAADGVVTITQTTTTTVIPDLTASGLVASPPGVGLVGATLYSFSLQNPPSGGVPPYTITWEFGDGNAAAGPTASHQYADTGDFTAKATITDSANKSVVLTEPIVIRGVSGRWTVDFEGAQVPESLDLVQSGGSVTGAINHTADGPGAGEGSVSNPKSMSLSLTFAGALPAPYVATFVGKLDERLVTWTGTVTGYPACPCLFTATKN